MISEDRKKFESTFMAEYWTLRKRIYAPEDKDSYWNDLVKSINDMAVRFGNDEYVIQILMVCVDDIERRAGSGKYSGQIDMCEFLLNKWRKERGLPRLVPEGVRT